ncbi:ribosome maturation factor RimP [Thermodesulfobacteriota bacterium]
MDAEAITASIKELADPVAADEGAEIVAVELLTQHGQWVLRISIEKDGGVTIDDCAAVSRQVARLLEVRDPIPNGYVLEVSSPGLNRPLTSEEDYRRFKGEKARIRLHNPIDGRRNFRGRIGEVEAGCVDLVDDKGKHAKIPIESVQKANLIGKI